MQFITCSVMPCKTCHAFEMSFKGAAKFCFMYSHVVIILFSTGLYQGFIYYCLFVFSVFCLFYVSNLISSKKTVFD